MRIDRHSKGVLLGIAAVSLMATLTAHAEFRGVLTVSSNDVYRGYSKSRNQPALQTNLDYEHDSGLYGGVWVSTVNFDDKAFPDRANVEINPYLGWTIRLGERWRGDVSASRYLYNGKIFGRDSDFNEFYGALHFRDLFSARVGYAYDAYRRKATTLVYELTGRYAFSDRLQASLGLGYNAARELLNYNNFYWNAGLTWYFNRHVAADLRYVDTHVPSYPSEAESETFRLRPLDTPILFSLSVGF